MRDEVGEVGAERDVHRTGNVHPALERQLEGGCDRGAGAVRPPDHVLGPDIELAAVEPIENPDGDPPVGVLGMREVLGREPRLRTTDRGVLHEDRLEVRLRDVAVEGRRGEHVVGLAGGVGTPTTGSARVPHRPGRCRTRCRR